MQRAGKLILIGLLLASSAAGQTPPVKPHLFMWPGSNNVSGSGSSVTPAPTSAIPIIRDDWNALWSDPDNDVVRSAALAADLTFYDPTGLSPCLATDAANGWIDLDHIAIFPRYIGIDLFVNDAPSQNPIDPGTDSRTVRGARWPYEWSFFFPNDRLVGLRDVPTGSGPRFPGTRDDGLIQVPGSAPALYYYEIGASNRSYRHPFLLNATADSRLKVYTEAWAAELDAKLHSQQATAAGIYAAQPTFIFDAEQAHVVQRPDKHSCIYMLWFLTQAKVPRTTDHYIWDTFRVPGSMGWTPPRAERCMKPAFGGGQTWPVVYIEADDDARCDCWSGVLGPRRPCPGAGGHTFGIDQHDDSVHLR